MEQVKNEWVVVNLFVNEAWLLTSVEVKDTADTTDIGQINFVPLSMRRKIKSSEIHLPHLRSLSRLHLIGLWIEFRDNRDQSAENSLLYHRYLSC